MARFRDHDEVAVLFFVDDFCADDFAGFFRDVSGFDAGAAAGLESIVDDFGHFAEAVSHDDEEVGFGRIFNDVHFDNNVIFLYFNAANADGGATHVAGVLLVEADAFAFARDDEDFVAFGNFFDPFERVVVAEANGDEAGFADIDELFNGGFFNCSAGCGHHEVFACKTFAGFEDGCDDFVFLHLKEIDDRLAFGLARGGGDFIDGEFEDAALVGEVKEFVVVVSVADDFDFVVFFGCAADDAFAATVLGFEGVDRDAFDVIFLGEHHDDRFIRDGVFAGNAVDGVFDDFGAAFVTVFFFNFSHFFFHDLADAFGVGEDCFEFVDEG